MHLLAKNNVKCKVVYGPWCDFPYPAIMIAEDSYRKASIIILFSAKKDTIDLRCHNTEVGRVMKKLVFPCWLNDTFKNVQMTSPLISNDISTNIKCSSPLISKVSSTLISNDVSTNFK